MRAVPALRAALAAVLALGAASALGAEDAARGRAIFRANCAQCHGENADGHGPLAARFKPPPANITVSTKSDDYMLQIVTLGGEALGRSGAMPEWGLELSGGEILDVVTYLRKVVNDSKAQKTASRAGVK